MKRDRIKLIVPTWPAVIYIILAIILLPWTIYLGATLPTHHLSAHWDVSWTGLDVGLIVTMLMTGIFAFKRSRWIVISSTMVGSFLLVDAWFDVMSERRSVDLHQSIILAIFVELPLAFISYYISFYVLRDHPIRPDLINSRKD
jgi:hypothetical protein